MFFFKYDIFQACSIFPIYLCIKLMYNNLFISIRNARFKKHIHSNCSFNLFESIYYLIFNEIKTIQFNINFHGSHLKRVTNEMPSITLNASENVTQFLQLLASMDIFSLKAKIKERKNKATAFQQNMTRKTTDIFTHITNKHTYMHNTQVISNGTK